ncbi:DNA-binding domain-containing protein [Polycladidibacter stylochi]|uniref:HvfC/BufC N-terminal domain-containing protein n=1 Tax=Polycladidibacter stylochi TaxID=1807766 RepID=UPI000834E00D|nr:DNA-binding domain-containing protein [Pseudovibrio stylochi]
MLPSVDMKKANNSIQAHNELQKAFSLGLIDSRREVPTGIVKSRGIISKKRFDVYRNNVMASLIEALAANYPAVQKLVGDDYFKALASIYIYSQPPSQPVLYEYGESFAQFLASFPGLVDFPYLESVAKLEWSWLSSFHSADDRSFDFSNEENRLGKPIGDCQFRPTKSVRLICCDYDVTGAYIRNTSANINCEIMRLYSSKKDEHYQDLAVGPAYYLFVRPDLSPELYCLDMAGFELFNELVRGKSLNEALVKAASKSTPNGELDAQEFLEKLFSSNTLVLSG